MDSVTLTEFLLARIAEDEAIATDVRVGAPSAWMQVGSELATCNEDPGHVACAHERVRAECEAKRRIVALYEYARETGQGPGGYLERALAALALPYADHPDYRSEWKP